MQSRELCKLDRQSPDHVGLRRYLTDIPSQTGMLREFSARFTDSAMPTDAARASGIARARERFAEGQISEARLLSALSRATGLQISVGATAAGQSTTSASVPPIAAQRKHLGDPRIL